MLKYMYITGGSNTVQPTDTQLREHAGSDNGQSGCGQCGSGTCTLHILRGNGQQRLPQQLSHAQLPYSQSVQWPTIRRLLNSAIHWPTHCK